MGNSTSKKGDCIRALESIRTDAQERWENISVQLIEVEYQLIDTRSIPNLKLTELLKKRSELRRHQKILKSNVTMADRGIIMIHQKECEILCKKTEKIFKSFTKPSSLQIQVSDGEVDELLASLVS